MNNNNNNNDKYLLVGIIFVSIILGSFVFYIGKVLVEARLSRSNTIATIGKSETKPTVSPSSSNTTQKSSSTSSTTSQSKADPVIANDFEKLVVINGRPLVFAASVEGDKGPAVGKSDGKYLGIWVTRDWDFLTDIDKRAFVKLHLSVFNQWRGKDDGIVMVFDSSDTELASGNKLSISLKNK